MKFQSRVCIKANHEPIKWGYTLFLITPLLAVAPVVLYLRNMVDQNPLLVPDAANVAIFQISYLWEDVRMADVLGACGLAVSDAVQCIRTREY